MAPILPGFAAFGHPAVRNTPVQTVKGGEIRRRGLLGAVSGPQTASRTLT